MAKATRPEDIGRRSLPARNPFLAGGAVWLWSSRTPCGVVGTPLSGQLPQEMPPAGHPGSMCSRCWMDGQMDGKTLWPSSPQRGWGGPSLPTRDLHQQGRSVPKAWGTICLPQSLRSRCLPGVLRYIRVCSGVQSSCLRGRGMDPPWPLLGCLPCLSYPAQPPCPSSCPFLLLWDSARNQPGPAPAPPPE